MATKVEQNNGSCLLWYVNVLHWNYRGFVEFPEKLVQRHDDVSDLYLKGNKLRTIPASISQLTQLRELYLSDNQLTSIPDSICHLEHLRCLDLSGNALTHLPDDLWRLRYLRTLALNDNKLIRLPLSIQKMNALRKINVNDNCLMWLPQIIGKNLYSSTVSFWRNMYLHHVPFAAWLHLLQDCAIPVGESLCFLDRTSRSHGPVRNTFAIDNHRMNIVVPPEFVRVQQYSSSSPPSLCEMCLRKVFTNKRAFEWTKSEGDPWICLPKYLKESLLRGPTSFCDYSKCRKPLFGCSIMVVCKKEVNKNEFKQILITSYFCTKVCCEKWTRAFKIKHLKWEKIL